jgi:SAM-dependent methyltransferase
MASDIATWNSRYLQAAAPPAGAAQVLAQNLHLLPSRGTALDLACGLGTNALLLAELGLDTHAWDFSDVAIGQLRASSPLPNLHPAVRDVVQRPPGPGCFDVIVVSRFLERSLAPLLVAALRPGGLLYYQTFTRTRVDNSGPADDSFRLADNELLALFAALKILVYREEGACGDPTQGLRNQAMLVAQKP